MANESQGQDQSQKPEQKSNWFKVFWIVVATIAVILILLWTFWLRYLAYTDDAYVHGNKIVVTPLQEGTVIQIHTDDTFFVKQGQVIAELDPTYPNINLNTMKDKLGTVVREIYQDFHSTFAMEAETRSKLAQLIYAKQEWEHRLHVIDQGGVSLEDLQWSQAGIRSAYFAFRQAESEYKKMRALIESTSIRTNPFVQKAADDVRDAVVRVFRRKIYAPNTGLVAQRTAQVGMYFNAGDPLMSVIPLDQIWINANYKETQMHHMRIGQTVKLMADMYGFGVIYHGVIVGLPGGAGNAFSLLPPQNLSGNWIKIVQRLPVRIALRPEELKKHPLRIRMTMRALTDLRFDGEIVPDTTWGPLYETEMLLEEDAGADEIINQIIEENIDESLRRFEYEDYTSDYKQFEEDFDDLFNDDVKVEDYDF